MTSDENPADTVIKAAAAVLNGAIVREALAGNLEIEVFTGDGISLERALAHSLAEAGLLADPADRDEVAFISEEARMRAAELDPQTTIRNLIQDKQTIMELVTKNRLRAERADAEVARLRKLVEELGGTA